MFKQTMFLLVLMFVICGTAPSISAEDATLSSVAQKAKSIVEAAHAYFQENSGDMDAAQKALMNDPRFRDDTKDLYVFLYSYDIPKQEAICRAHGARPDFIGKNLWNLRSADGRFILREITEMLEKEGNGWKEYEWLHPVKKKVQTKQSYFVKIVLKDGQNALTGCGFWK